MTSAMPVIASVVLGAVFLVAGGSKLAAGADWAVQAKGLRAPAFVVPILPWIEIALGALLVVQVERRGSSVAALVLLVGFSVAIGRQLAQGNRPPCACFGAWSAKPLGPGHLVRNTLLIGVAVIAML